MSLTGGTGMSAMVLAMNTAFNDCFDDVDDRCCGVNCMQSWPARTVSMAVFSIRFTYRRPRATAIVGFATVADDEGR